MSPQSIGTYLENGKKPINKFFTFVVFLIVTVGLLAFFSASFGLLGRGSGPTFENIVRGQIFYGILPGIVLMIVMMNLKYILWRKMAFLAFIFAVELKEVHEQAQVIGQGDGSKNEIAASKKSEVGRNDPCPCGSGKKYKKCHGAN
jgi:hypothetical protein